MSNGRRLNAATQQQQQNSDDAGQEPESLPGVVPSAAT
jgi:hypothetical protein